MASRHNVRAPRSTPKRDALAIGRRLAISVLLVALVVLGLLVLTHHNKQTSSASSAGKVSPTIPKHPTTLSSQQLSTLASFAKVADDKDPSKHATYKLTYNSFDVPGASKHIVIAQVPGHRSFKTGTSELLVSATKTYYCTTARRVTCHATKSVSTSPLGKLASIYTPEYYRSTIRTLSKLIHLGVAYKFSSTAETIAGQPSQCVSWSYQFSRVTLCIAKTDVVTYFAIWGLSKTGNPLALTLSLRLASYSTHVTPKDLALPTKGAH